MADSVHVEHTTHDGRGTTWQLSYGKNSWSLTLYLATNTTIVGCVLSPAEVLQLADALLNAHPDLKALEQQ